jgi:hypothetical protein
MPKVWICLSRSVIYEVYDSEEAAKKWAYETKWKANMDSEVIEKEVLAVFKSPLE